MDDLTRKRLEHNEAVFRDVNEEIEDRAGGKAVLECVCECADAACTETLRIVRDEYERVRSDPTHFLVVPGHEQGEIERVVAEHDSYTVVEKPRVPV